jgi:TonB family protein
VLQPLQLSDVSVRYAEEIAELRDFLVKAGCEVRTGEALGQIADRIARDRTFHRDLTSHVWVMIDQCERISYSDLLGVLAIAAAGSSLAATAEEDVAHRLLRFLMEARHSLDGLSENKGGAAPLLLLRERELPSADEPRDRDSGRRWLPWVIAAVCVCVAVLTGMWLKSRPRESAGNPPVSVGSAAAGNVATGPMVAPVTTIPAMTVPATTESVTPPVSRPGERAGRAGLPSGNARRNSRATSPQRTPVAAPYVAAPAASVPPPVIASAVHGPAPVAPVTAATSRPAGSFTAPSVAGAATPSAAGAIRGAGVAGPARTVAPSAANGKLSPVPSLARPDAQQAEDEISSSRTPVLRRRTEATSAAGPDGRTNVAAAGTPPAVSAAASSGSAGATGGGTVRGTSLGVMASNLMYSPMPAYPAAASASHVQGEVKISADVDRQGKVASVRVISGPPLLRDAALDAVQHWRYRPYVSAGAPVPMAAIEVLDFELP